MSNTVKIKNKKKKQEVKVNYKLWAIVFGVFIAVIVGLSVWASFHWGVGMGTIGVRPVTPENADAAATAATAAEPTAENTTDGAMVLTPEQLKEMGISLEDLQEEGAEAAAEEGAAPEEASQEGAAAEDNTKNGDKAASE